MSSAYEALLARRFSRGTPVNHVWFQDALGPQIGCGAAGGQSWSPRSVVLQGMLPAARLRLRHIPCRHGRPATEPALCSTSTVNLFVTWSKVTLEHCVSHCSC